MQCWCLVGVIGPAVSPVDWFWFRVEGGDEVGWSVPFGCSRGEAAGSSGDWHPCCRDILLDLRGKHRPDVVSPGLPVVRDATANSQG